MTETFDSQSQEQNPESSSKKERLDSLLATFDEAEKILEAEGRETAKLLLPKIYDDLIDLNNRDKEDWETIWVWNPEGNLTEGEFYSLNLRRKSLSNTIGIKTASGDIRHDLNEI